MKKPTMIIQVFTRDMIHQELQERNYGVHWLIYLEHKQTFICLSMWNIFNGKWLCSPKGMRKMQC